MAAVQKKERVTDSDMFLDVDVRYLILCEDVNRT